MKKSISGKSIFNIMVVILSAGLIIYFCISENGLSDLIKNARSFNIFWLSMAVIFQLLNIVIDALLILIFTRSSVGGYSIKKSFKTCMVGQFFSAVTPGASGGQPMQVYIMSKQNIDPGVASSCLIQKFLIYQSALSVYSVLAILIRFQFFYSFLNPFMWGLAIIGFLGQIFVILLLLMFSFNRKLTQKIIHFIFTILKKIHIIKDSESSFASMNKQLDAFHIGNKKLLEGKKLIIKTFILTLVQLTLMFSVPYCIYRALNLFGANIFDMIASQSFVNMASSLAPLPGASGASEGSFFVFFNNFFTPQTIKSSILLWRIITYYLIILISAPFSKISKNNDIHTLLDSKAKD